MSTIKYAVIYVDTDKIIRTFDELAQARYYITDCFGPEWAKVTIVNLETAQSRLRFRKKQGK